MEEPREEVSLEPHEPVTCAAGAPRVFIDRQTLDDMNAHAAEETAHEIAGIMIGTVIEGACPVVMVEASIRGQHLTYTRGSVTFTHDTWNEINRVKDEQYPEKRIVGWYHSHPGFGLFLSNYDLFIHKGFFTAPWQIAFVTDPKAKTYGCFTWQDGDLGQDHTFQISDQTEGRYAAPEPEAPPSQPIVTIAAPVQPTSRDQGTMLALWVLSGLLALVALLAVSNYAGVARLSGLPRQVTAVSAQMGQLQIDLQALKHGTEAHKSEAADTSPASPGGASASPSAPTSASEGHEPSAKPGPPGS